MAQHGGENWLTVDEAAMRLGVEPAALHKRADSIGIGRIEAKTFTIDERSSRHIREADVERMAVEGLPHPDWEAHEAGELFQMPEKWLTLRRSHSAPSAFIALVPMTLGPHGRHLQAGDLLAEGEDTAINLSTVAELPLDRGVIGLIRRQMVEITELRAQVDHRA